MHASSTASLPGCTLAATLERASPRDPSMSATACAVLLLKARASCMLLTASCAERHSEKERCGAKSIHSVAVSAGPSRLAGNTSIGSQEGSSRSLIACAQRSRQLLSVKKGPATPCMYMRACHHKICQGFCDSNCSQTSQTGCGCMVDTLRPHLCCSKNRRRAPAALAPRVSPAAASSTALSSSTLLNGLPRSAKPYLSSSSVLLSSP